MPGEDNLPVETRCKEPEIANNEKMPINWMKKYFLTSLLLLLFAIGKAAKVDTVSIYSTAMHRAFPCVVVLPDAYSQPDRHYPVVYLLHGYSGNYSDWIKKVPALQQWADAYHLILVCPDGGFGSWYLDSPVDPTMRFETYVAREVPAYIDQHYPTLPDRLHRAITGLSMGGHGALFLGIRHKDFFGAAGSMSGGVDIRPFPENWDLKKRLGDIETNRDNWDRYTVISVANQLRNGDLQLIFDCGVKDFFYKVNKQLHEKLLQQGIAHDYTERPGEHNWAYWENAVAYQLLFFHRFFEASGARNGTAAF